MKHPSEMPGAQDMRADLQLARRCVEDVRAREELFRSYAPQIHRLARRIVGNAADADDVLQEVFVQVFGSIRTYRGEAPLGAWLRRVAVRAACRHCRQRTRRTRLELVEDPPQPAVDPGRAAESQAMARRVDALVQRLPETRRAVFLLHEVEGYPLAEVAAMLDISMTAAKKRVWRARQELQRMARRDPALREILERAERGGDD